MAYVDDDRDGAHVSDVVFVDAPHDPGTDEELPDRAYREWPRLRRARVPLTVLAVLVVVAAVIGTVIHDRPADTPVAQRSATPRPIAPPIVPTDASAEPNDVLVPARPGVLLHVHDGIVIGPVPGRAGGPTIVPAVLDVPRGAALLTFVRAHAPCPIRIGCAVGTTAPPPVATALHSAYPHARDVVEASVHMDGVLSYRALIARSGRSLIELVVRPSDAGDVFQTGTRDLPGRRYVGYARSVSNGFTVDVQVHARGGQPPAVGIEQLATDDRLLD